MGKMKEMKKERLTYNEKEICEKEEKKNDIR
jgi:hypothetical protein